MNAVTKSAYFALSGGLDLVTPALSMPPGRTFDSLNYEPEINGGYRRIDGYERFDGRPSPTDTAKYAVLPVQLTAFLSMNDTITGVTSGKTGKVLQQVHANGNTVLVLGRCDLTSSNFAAGEAIQTSAGIVVGIVQKIASLADFPEQDADYQLLAANDIRGIIQSVPGSGPVRGIFMLNDVVYAFRDHTDGVTQRLYRSSGTGWTLVPYGQEIQFASGSSAINDGDTITATDFSATVVKVLVRSGTWNSTGQPQAKGTLIVSNVTGTLASGSVLQVAGVNRATASTTVTNINRNAGGKMELVKYSFGAKTGPQVVYGADGVNLAFEFNGASFIPIRTRDTGVDFPTHVACHLNYLFLSFGSNFQWSVVSAPYTWDGTLGAAELAAGATITAMLPMVGGNQAPAMAIFSQERVSMLYGSSSQSFRVQNAISEVGYSAGTVQPVSGTAFGLTARGLQTLAATDTFGDFNFAAISEKIQPLVNKLRGKETASVTLKNKNQYRVYYGDSVGTCIVVGIAGEQVAGLMKLEYGKPVRCIWTETFSNGVERTFFGSDDGYVYEDNKGTSFDGAAIESWVRLVFNHMKSPRLRKRYRRAVIEAQVAAFSKVNFSYDLGYGNPEVTPPPNIDDAIMVGGNGGYWDQLTWDQFHWDAQTVISPVVKIEGTEKNISIIFYSNRAQDGSHTVQGITLDYTERRNER